MSYLRPQFSLIAHRGGGLERPENTMLAFENAAAVWPDAIFELDVHQTRDGEVVVFHDDTLERCTDGKGRIWETNWADLKKLDAAYNFSFNQGKTFPDRGKGIRIPLLKEVLLKFSKSRVSVEFKHPTPFLGDKVVDIIRQCSAQDRVVLAGDDHENLVRVSRLAPEMCSGFSAREVRKTLIWNRLGLPRLGPRRGQVLQVPVRHKNIEIVTPKFVQQAHDRGLHVHVWTINDEATMRQLIGMGVDGIVTDAPSLLLRVARAAKKI